MYFSKNCTKRTKNRYSLSQILEYEDLHILQIKYAYSACSAPQ